MGPLDGYSVKSKQNADGRDEGKNRQVLPTFHKRTETPRRPLFYRDIGSIRRCGVTAALDHHHMGVLLCPWSPVLFRLALMGRL